MFIEVTNLKWIPLGGESYLQKQCSSMSFKRTQERGYKDKKQIFFPEYFLPETSYDWETFCKLLEAIKSDEKFSEREMELCMGVKKAIHQTRICRKRCL